MRCKLLFRCKQQGLTLIELLISLVIISIVITLCANGFSFGNRVWQKVDDEQAYLDETVTTQRFIRKILSEAIYFPLQNNQIQNKEIKNEYFKGDVENMVFLAPSPQYGLDDYLYIYEIFKRKVGDSYDLGLRYLPANSYFSGLKNTTDREVKLVQNVINIEFKYYGLSKSGKQAWFSSWRKQDQLPSMVSIDIETTNSTQTWPKLIAKTKFGPHKTL